MEKNSVPENFTQNMECMDAKEKLINFLKYKPWSNGVPLNYVIRDNIDAIVRTNMKFLDNCA